MKKTGEASQLPVTLPISWLSNTSPQKGACSLESFDPLLPLGIEVIHAQVHLLGRPLPRTEGFVVSGWLTTQCRLTCHHCSGEILSPCETAIHAHFYPSLALFKPSNLLSLGLPQFEATPEGEFPLGQLLVHSLLTVLSGEISHQQLQQACLLLPQGCLNQEEAKQFVDEPSLSF